MSNPGLLGQRLLPLTAAVALASTIAGPPPLTGQALTCDLSAFTATSGLSAAMVNGRLILGWEGAGTDRLSLILSVDNGAPRVDELAISSSSTPRTVIASDAAFEFKIVEGFRRISNQQLVPLRALDVELTPEVVDRYKWDVFWDAPLDLRDAPRQNNPPPMEGVADQPGLPRSASEIRRADASYAVSTCRVTRDGRTLSVAFPGMRLGSFSGELVLSVYSGTNLIRAEAVASTELPSVAYKYDVGITGLDLNEGSEVRWRDIASQMQAYGLRGPANEDHVVLKAANRLVVAETNGGAIAAFPPPHTFFWAREIEINVGNNWYRKDDDSSFSIGVRQGEQEVVERYLANWSLYSAPPVPSNTWPRTSIRP